MATSPRPNQDILEVDDHRRIQNRLAQRRHRRKLHHFELSVGGSLTGSIEKKALLKQAALEQQQQQQQQPTLGFGTLPVTPDYGGSSIVQVDDMPFDTFNTVLPFSENDLSMWNGALTPWEDGSATSTSSNPPAAPTSVVESTPSLNAMFLATVADDIATPEAARKAAMDFWRHSNRRGRSIPTFSNDMNETLVHTAARGNDVITLKLLAQHGFPLNERDSEGRTPLHVAYAENHMEAILWLLENGADVQAVDSQGRSTLSMAVNNKCPIGVKLMLSHGAAPILAM